MRRGILVFFSLLLLVVLAAACSSKSPETSQPSGETNGNAEKQKDPVTLEIFLNNPAMDEAKFQNLIAGPLKEKYPYIDVNLTVATAEMTFENLLAAGEIPDIVYSPLFVQNYVDSDYALDLTEHIKKRNIDLSGVYPEIMEGIKSFGENGEIYQFPWMSQSFALFYNKAVFDTFGANYPTDGMTWDETIELAKQVTREENGVQYYGLGFPGGRYINIVTLANPLSIEVWDDENEKGFVSDEWKVPFTTMMSYFGLDEYRLCEGCKGYFELFFDGGVGMWPFWTTDFMNTLMKRGEGMDWDVVQAPSFPEAKNKYYQVDYHGWVVSKLTKNIDAVMDFLEVTISDEVQLAAAKAGVEPAVAEFAPQFLSGNPFAEGKNIAGIFKSTPSSLIKQSEYNGDVLDRIREAARQVQDGNIDVNTALRLAEEEAQQLIEARKAAK